MSYQYTSRQAYRDLKRVNDKQAQVFRVIELAQPASNYDIAKHLSWPINRVTPRVLELRDMDFIELAHKARHPATNRTMMFWRVKKLVGIPSLDEDPKLKPEIQPGRLFELETVKPSFRMEL